MHNQSTAPTPTKTLSVRRGSRKSPKAHLSIEAYHKLNRSQSVAQFISGDLMQRELNGLHQLYIPHILSYLNEDIGFVLDELKQKGLCADFLPHSPR